MSAKHTPGPWTLTPDWSRIGISGAAVLIAGKDGVRVLDQYAYEGMHMEEANAARIVACVNACEGMDNPVAEIARLREDSGFLESYRTVAASKEADLREALDALDDAATRLHDLWEVSDIQSPETLERVNAVRRKHGRAV